MIRVYHTSFFPLFYYAKNARPLCFYIRYARRRIIGRIYCAISSKERQSDRNNYNIITSVVMFHVSLRFRWEIIVVKRFMTFLLPQLGQIDS